MRHKEFLKEYGITQEQWADGLRKHQALMGKLRVFVQHLIDSGDAKDELEIVQAMDELSEHIWQDEFLKLDGIPEFDDL